MIKYSDSPKSAEKWKKLEEVTSPEFVDAMKDLYSIYDAELVEWVANLYDPKIGGWYYSNSARDNDTAVWQEKEYKMLPDAESTCQALGFVGSSGISGGKPYEEFLPEEMKKEIGDFIYSLQDPDGFFYHPQWGKNIGLSRRGRDFSWSTSMLERLGRKLRYPTILDKPAEKNEDVGETLIPDHLKSKEAFIEWLDSLDVEHKSYPAGNTTSSQFAQIISQGLADVCIDYYTKRQNPENGLWHDKSDYYGVNGFMKISGIYNRAGLVIPYSDKAAYSAMAAIESDEPIGAVVDLWNNWVAIANIKTSLRKFGGEEGCAFAEELVKELRRRAIGAIRKTKEKIQDFKKPDHSFSYARKYPSPISQGCAVCVPYLPEGDMNAMVISVTLMIGMIYGALDLGGYAVPLFGEEESKRFLEIIESKRRG